MAIKKAPKPLDVPDFNRLIVEVMEYVKWIERGEYHSDGDYESWIFAAAVEAVYGDRVFDWVNVVIERMDEDE